MNPSFNLDPIYVPHWAQRRLASHNAQLSEILDLNRVKDYFSQEELSMLLVANVETQHFTGVQTSNGLIDDWSNQNRPLTELLQQLPSYSVKFFCTRLKQTSVGPFWSKNTEPSKQGDVYSVTTEPHDAIRATPKIVVVLGDDFFDADVKEGLRFDVLKASYVFETLEELAQGPVFRTHVLNLVA